jgi:nicotinate dehydrogenase subunit A
VTHVFDSPRSLPVPTPLTRRLTLNGEDRTVTVADDAEQLLYVLRNQLDQRGPKFGCGVAQCGACTVLIDGEIRRSCVTPVRSVPDSAAVSTLDGLGTPDDLHPLQKAFIELQAGQCAYCCNGLIMGAHGWLQQRKASGNTAIPTDEEIAAFLSGEAEGSTFTYLCRCGAHARIIRAISQAAAEVLR